MDGNGIVFPGMVQACGVLIKSNSGCNGFSVAAGVFFMLILRRHQDYIVLAVSEAVTGSGPFNIYGNYWDGADVNIIYGSVHFITYPHGNAIIERSGKNFCSLHDVLAKMGIYTGDFFR